MSGVKHMMDEVASRMEIDDPNDPKVQAEVARLLSITDRRLVLIESHPNSGGFWVGRVGTEREVLEYLKKAEAEGNLDYAFSLIELKKGAGDEITDWIEFDGTDPIKLLERTPGGTTNGTPPLPGLEARLAGIQAEAYGQHRSVWSILQSLTDDEVAETFSDLLETVLQEGRTLIIPEVQPCQSR